VNLGLFKRGNPHTTIAHLSLFVEERKHSVMKGARSEECREGFIYSFDLEDEDSNI
jgi:hypothetical protein